MANEVQISWTSGKTLDRYLTSGSQRYNGSTFEAFNSSHWTTYASSLTEQGTSGDYFGDLPTGLAAGVYIATVRERAGGSAAITDPTIGGGNYYYDGSNWISLVNIEAQTTEVLSVLDGLGGSNITISVINPVAVGGDITIVRGDDYSASDGRALVWTTTDSSLWPDLTGASIAFTATKTASNDNTGSASITTSGVVLTPTGANKSVEVQLTHASTSGLAIGSSGYKYDVQATLAGSSRIVTLVLGSMTVREDQTQ